MKKILLLLALFAAALGAKAQVYQVYPQYGGEWNRLQARYALGIPNDTFAIPTAKKNMPHLAMIAETAYYWSVAGQLWIELSGGGGGPETDPLALKILSNLSDLNNAATARTNLGLTTVGNNLATATNPSAVRWIRVNADNTISFRTAAETLGDIGGIGSYTETDPLALKIASNLSDLNNAGTARTNLGGTTVGSNIFTASNPSAVRWIRVNADNTITFRTAAETLGDIGAQTALSGTGYAKFSGTTPSYLTPTQVTADLNTFTTALKGLVPPSGAAVGNFLKDDGTWGSPAGTGTVNGGLANTLAYYPANGTTVDDIAAIAAFRAVVSDANGLPTHSATTATEISRLAGLSSNVQTQLDAKLAIANNLSDVANVGTSRTNLGATTVGGNIFTATNPSAVRWIRVNADNTITFRTAAETLADVGGISSYTETDPLALKIASNLSDLNSAATARTNLGGTTVGKNIFIATNPSAVTWIRVNADNTVSFRTAAETLADIGADSAYVRMTLLDDTTALFWHRYGSGLVPDTFAVSGAGSGGSYTETDPLALKIASNLSDLNNAATARTNLGLTTVGNSIATATNPSAVRWIRVNADNTITFRTAAETLGDIGGISSYTETDPLALKIASNLSDLNNAATARTNIGLTTVGNNLATASNPSAVRWIRVNADNTVTFRTAAETLSDIGGISSYTETDPLALKIASNLSDLNNAGTARTNLGGTTVGSNIFTASNPSAVRWIRVNADNTITFRSADNTLADLGGWSTITNIGLTNGVNNFFGTASNVPILFRVNAQPWGGFYPAGNVNIGLNSGGGTSVGNSAGKNDVSSNQENSYFGHQSGMYNIDGNKNTFVGLYGKTVHGNENSILGVHGGESGNSGNTNSGNGYSVLRWNRNGSNNSGLGGLALYKNTTVVESVTITNGGTGYGGTPPTVTFTTPPASVIPGIPHVLATGTAIVDGGGVVTGVTITNNGSGYGWETDYGLSAATVTFSGGSGSGATGTIVLASGDGNVGVGQSALAFSEWGDNNTAVGRTAGYGVGGSEASYFDDNSTFIGYLSSRSGNIARTTKLTNATAIGYNAKVGASNSLVLGGLSSDQPAVGIGTAYPLAGLHVIETTEQFRAGYDSTNYMKATVGSTGSTTWDLVGTSPEWTLVDKLNTQDVIIAGTYLLRLGSDGSDPSPPSSGYMYYNSNTNKFRCYENNAWVNCVGSGGSGDMVLASVQTVTGAKTFETNKLILDGSTSGETTINAAAVAGTTTITLPGTTGTVALTSDITPAKNSDAINIYQALGSTVLAEPAYNILQLTAAATITDQQLRLVAVWLPKDATVTGVKWFQTTAGAYTADNYNGVGLYSYSGGTLTLVASSTDDGNIWKATTGTWGTKAFSSTYAATAGLYFIGAIYSNSAQTTAPGWAIVASTQANAPLLDFTNSAKMIAFLSAQTSLPASTTMAALGVNNVNYYFALY